MRRRELIAGLASQGEALTDTEGRNSRPERA